LTKIINEQEGVNKTLKDKQKSAVSVQVDGKKQMRLWKDLLRQMELKRRLVNVKFSFFLSSLIFRKNEILKFYYLCNN
jgi:hypothetical protein